MYPTILSVNTKTGCSIDLPIIGHCKPTKNCSQACYSRMGTQSWPNSIKKHIRTSEYLKGTDISLLIEECRIYSSVRLNGSGDLLAEHVPNILRLAEACSSTQFWGMTRKLDIANAINGNLPNLKLLVSVDASSPKPVWKYTGKICFGPRLPGDVIPENMPNLITVFPKHVHGQVVKGLDEHPKDCPAVWHKISGCTACGRCWKW